MQENYGNPPAIKPKETTAAARFHHRLPVIIAVSIFCWPAGIFLFWQSKRRAAAVALSLVVALAVAAVGIGAAALWRHAERSVSPVEEAEVTPIQRPDEGPSVAATPQRDADAEEKAEQASRDAATRRGFREKSPAERATAIRETCPPGNCDRRAMWMVVDAAASPAERKRLDAQANAALAADDRVTDARSAAEGVGARAAFAKRYDGELLDRGMNPESVVATGAGNTTLRIRGWFCSRQFAHDFDDTAARTAGFTRLECDNGVETTTITMAP